MLARRPLWALSLLLSCAHTQPETQSDPFEARADALIAQAKTVERSMTPFVVGLAEANQGEMIKLEYRLKKRDSMLRKLHKIHGEHPDQSAEQIEIGDALRYTMRIDDEPPGHYVATVRSVVEQIEAEGNKVVLLKNYWPPGDNYSGVNGVFEHSSGLKWELQFHTSASLKVQAETRPMYEEIRLDSTAPERREELFQQMTQMWDTVPIPKDILQPNALPHEEILEREQP